MTGVHNHLQIALPDGDLRDDAKLTTAASNALAGNVTVPDTVEATAADGHVYLAGAVAYGTKRGEAPGLTPDHLNVPLPGRTGPGGGRTGAVLLSPLIKPGIVSTVPYNHYSLLRTIEDICGLPHLGDAAMPQIRSFGPDVFG